MEWFDQPTISGHIDGDGKSIVWNDGEIWTRELASVSRLQAVCEPEGEPTNNSVLERLTAAIDDGEPHSIVEARSTERMQTCPAAAGTESSETVCTMLPGGEEGRFEATTPFSGDEGPQPLFDRSRIRPTTWSLSTPLLATN